MLFKNNNFSFKFCLVGLSALETSEITELIINNGGEISTDRNPPVITFTNSKDSGRTGKPVFHVNYIRECVRHQKLLDLIHFIIGPPGYFGCLQCIFTRGKNLCQLHSSSIADFSPCFESTQIESSSDINDGSRTRMEHNYAHGDSLDTQEAKRPCNNEHVTEVVPQILNQSQTEPVLSSSESPQDADFFTPESPQNTDLPAADSPQDADFLPDESPQDSDRLPPDSPQTIELSPAETPRDSDFLPDEIIQDVVQIPPESPQNAELLPAESPQNVDFRPDEMLQDVVQVPPESPQNAVVLPTASPQDAEFLPDEMSPEVVILPDESPPDVECVNSSASMISPTPTKSERVKRSDGFIPIKLPFVAKSEKQSSDQGMVESDQGQGVEVIIEDIVPLKVGVPEAVRFEELDASRGAKKKTKKKGESETKAVGSPKNRVKPAVLDTVKVAGSGRTKETLEDLERFRLTSSESDDTDYKPVITEIARERRKVIRKKLNTTLKKDSNKDNGASEDTQEPGAPLIDLTTDDYTIEASSEEERTGSGGRRDLDLPSTSKMNQSRHLNDEKNTTVSSTKCSGTISDNSDSDSALEDRNPRRALAKRSFVQTRRTNNVKKPKKLPPITRNILPWEQRQMVKYLIDNELISEARGLKVWKQMIEEGLLSHRTAQSLNNHFRKVLLPTIHRFEMDKRSLRKFRKLQA